MEGIPSGSVGGHGDERGNALLSVAHTIISLLIIALVDRNVGSC